MPKPKRSMKETRARGFKAPAKPVRAKKARSRKPKRAPTPLIDRLIAAAEEVSSGRAKTIPLTGLSDAELLAALSGLIIADDDD